MAVALQSNSSYKILSQDDSQRDKSVLLVKLTDSCLKSLEQHKTHTAKLSKSRRPTIQFKDDGKSGALFIPSKSGLDKDGTTFNFSSASLFNDSSTTGLDCLQQKRGDVGLVLLGNITDKMTVSATSDSYEATRHRMAEVENKRKGNSAKVIEVSRRDASKKIKRIQRQKIDFRKINNKFPQSTSSSSKGIREKVIHLLALRPLKKPEIRLKLEKDGVRLKDSSVLSNILQQVATMQDNQYGLNRHLYSEIQVDTWPVYSEEERKTIKNKLVSELGTSVDRLSPGPLASGLSSNNSSKRPLSRGANPAGKKPRIAHSSTTPKHETKQTSPPKLTSRATPQNATDARPSKKHLKVNRKVEKPLTNNGTSCNREDSTRNKNKSNDNDNNNNYCSSTQKESDEDYLAKYPEITSYEQRCSYKQDFVRGYAEFTALMERNDQVTRQFADLKERLKNLKEESEEAKLLHDEIFKLYDEKKEVVSEDRQKIHSLYPKLNHIKRLVIQYDEAHAR